MAYGVGVWAGAGAYGVCGGLGCVAATTAPFYLGRGGPRGGGVGGGAVGRGRPAPARPLPLLASCFPSCFRVPFGFSPPNSTHVVLSDHSRRFSLFVVAVFFH
jgi:hypothetical protein